MKELLIMLISVAFITACVSKEPFIKKDTSLPFEMSNSLKEVLYYASLAPSGHNAQMWRVEVDISAGKFVIYLDNSKLLTQVDPLARESYISLGAFIENMRRAFVAYGYETKIEIYNGERAEAAGVYFSGGVETPLNIGSLTVMEKRHTDKRNFNKVPIAEEKITALLEKYAEGIKYYPAGSEEFDYIAKGTIEANKVQAANLAKREELAHWLRFSDSEAKLMKDGLPAEQLGITGIKKFFYYLFMSRNSAKGDSFASTSVSLAKNAVENCSGFFIFTGGSEIKDWIETGMAFESFWLDGAEAGISIQPLSQILEENPFDKQILNMLGSGKKIQMIVRAGIVKDYGKNNMVRRNISEFILPYRLSYFK